MNTENKNEICFEDIVLDLYSRMVWRGEKIIFLTGKEFDFLLYFMLHPGKAISRREIFDNVWFGKISNPESNIIEVYIRYLRKKLGNPNFITTIRGYGYILIDTNKKYRMIIK